MSVKSTPITGRAAGRPDYTQQPTNTVTTPIVVSAPLVSPVNVTYKSPLPFDRNPTEQFPVSAEVVGPHVAATRWTYTVPANRKAIVETAKAHIARVSLTTLGSPPNAWATIFVGPDKNWASTSTYLVFAEIFTNNVGDQQNDTLPQSVTLQAGDTLTAVDQESNNVGGTVEYVLTAKITEFDA